MHVVGEHVSAMQVRITPEGDESNKIRQAGYSRVGPMHSPVCVRMCASSWLGYWNPLPHAGQVQGARAVGRLPVARPRGAFRPAVDVLGGVVLGEPSSGCFLFARVCGSRAWFWWW